MGLKIVIGLIRQCLLTGTNPWMYFQIHSHFFNTKKWIFSKIDIETHIPSKWKLQSIEINHTTTADDILMHNDFPLFGKPEWGQNANGISYIENKASLSKFLRHVKSNDIDYLIQPASAYNREYELCFTKDPDNLEQYQIHSLVQAINEDWNKVSSINAETRYKEILHELSPKQKDTLIEHIKQIWDFWIGRIWLRADSKKAMIEGKFEIFEINIFVPMPLKLLAYNVDESQKSAFFKKWITTLAKLTKNRPKQKYREVFLRKTYMHYKIQLIHNKTYMKLKQVIYKYIEEKFMNGCSDYNSLEVRRASRSKKQARDMFAANDIPHAKWKVFINPYTAYTFAKQVWFPLVLKPNVGWFSRWSHFPIMTWKEFWTAMFFVKWWWPSSVVEQYLLGKNYRVVTTRWSVDIAMQRTPGYVIWDWKSTISELMDRENEVRKEMKLSPIIYPLAKSGPVKRHLKKHGYSFESVLKKWEQVDMYHRVSLAPGWVLQTVDVDTITPKNKELFIKIVDVFGANLFGIDVIMEKWIDVDYDKQKTIFLELNSRPYLKMHSVPRTWKAPDMKPLYKKLDALEITNRGTF